MSETPKKEVMENTPPIGAGGMVSEELLITNIKKLKEGDKGVEVPSIDVLLLFIVEKLHDINKTLERIANAFEHVPSKTEMKPAKDVAPEYAKAPIESEPATLRIEEIIQKFEPVKDLVSIDTESSTQFVLVRPKEYLKDEWKKVNDIAKELGGEWVSQGKESHWQIPKMVKGQQSLAKPSTPKSEITDPIEKVKVLFPKDLADMLSFILEGKNIIIKPRQFLGSENFAKIASIVRDADGEYVSAGKESHFRISVK